MKEADVESGDLGVDEPNYGRIAVDAQVQGKPIPSLAEVVAAEPVGANAYQHGGDHYQKREYQHWDWVIDIDLPYLLGCATKYVARWQDKNGVEDLKKAEHYLVKAQERGVMPATNGGDKTLQFCEQLPSNDAFVIAAVVNGNYDAAIYSLRWMQVGEKVKVASDA